MVRLFAALVISLAMTIVVRAQTYPGDTPAPAGIEAQPLPAITPQSSSGPTSLIAPTASTSTMMPVTPREGPQERALDQSLGLLSASPQAGASSPAAPEPAVRPSAKEDAAIEARINAARTAPKPLQTPKIAQPSPPRLPAMPPTTIVGGSVARPASVAPAPTRWEGPEERALDQVDPLSGQAPTISDGPSQDPETRRLNGGN